MNKIIDNGNFVLRAKVSKIKTIDPDLAYYWLSFSSQLLTAKHAREEHTKFTALLSRDQLTKLRDIIDIHLLETV